MNPIVSFYQGTSPDRHGRTIESIWSYSDDQLEAIHNYIQFLFPLRDPGVAPAPLLDDETIRAFHDSPELRDRLLVSFDRMLRFHGLRREGDRVVPADDFTAKAANWLTPHNHNFLRITRILLCLKTLGLGQWSRAFFDCLRGIYEQSRSVIGPVTYRYWENAAR
jgi:hypothetical protein